MRSLSLLAILGVVSFPGAVWAKEPTPTKAYNDLAKKTQRLPPAEKAEVMKREALEWLARWEASGAKADGKHLYSIALFLEAAERYAEAAKNYQAVAVDPSVKERTRDLAVRNEAVLLTRSAYARTLGAEGVAKCLARLSAYADTMTGNPGRLSALSKFRHVLADAYDAAGDGKAARELRMQLIADDPGYLSKVVQPLVDGLLASAGDAGGYDALRKQAEEVLGTLRKVQAAEIAEKDKKLDDARAKLRSANPDALDADGNLTNKGKLDAGERAVSSAARALEGAQGLLEVIESYAQPFAMLGKPAPEWTLVKAFGDVSKLADAKGKVVLLHFWTTSRPDTVALFPVVRDLRKAHGEGLVTVGVTVTANVVYPQRYEADADLASKGKGGRLFYAARLADEQTPPSDEQSVFAEEAYRERELGAIETFIGNHEMKWPVVMIAKDEPEQKYALRRWPHAVLIDKQGRVRQFRSGDLTRADEAAVDRLNKLVKALLAE